MFNLLKQFLEQDCDAIVRQKLLADIKMHNAVRADVVHEFNFNRFNVYLDYQNEVARVEDELDTSEEGSCSISIPDFATALSEHSPQR